MNNDLSQNSNHNFICKEKWLVIISLWTYIYLTSWLYEGNHMVVFILLFFWPNKKKRLTVLVFVNGHHSPFWPYHHIFSLNQKTALCFVGSVVFSTSEKMSIIIITRKKGQFLSFIYIWHIYVGIKVYKYT